MVVLVLLLVALALAEMTAEPPRPYDGSPWGEREEPPGSDWVDPARVGYADGWRSPYFSMR
jgi:hypothetical protein